MEIDKLKNDGKRYVTKTWGCKLYPYEVEFLQKNNISFSKMVHTTIEELMLAIKFKIK